MPTIAFPRASVRELEEIETPIRAALGTKYLGASLNPRQVLLHLADGATADEQLAASVALQNAIAAINPQQQPPSQRRAQRTRAAQQGVAQADFAALKAQIEAANSVAQLKALLLVLLRLMWRMSAAQGLSDRDDPGE